MAIALTGIFVIVSAIIMPIHGTWILDLDLESYSNPKHAYYRFSLRLFCCCDCPASGACCQYELSDLDTCSERHCHNKFLICFSDGTSDESTDDCIYSGTIENNDSITFSNGLTMGGITNPIQFIGEGEKMSTVTIYVFDDLTGGGSDYRQVLIDEFRVNIPFDVTDGISSPTTFNGKKGIITMSLGYGIRCAEGFSGDDCSTPSSLFQPTHGTWILDLDLESYSNPTHAYYRFSSSRFCCCDCPSAGVCCANQLSYLNTCNDRDCHNRFLICFSDGSSDESSDDCVYSSTIEDDDSITFSNGLTMGGITNPIQFIGKGEETLNVTIYVFDDLTAGDDSDYRQTFIDEVQVTIPFDVTDGIGSPTTYNGKNGIITMSLGYGIRCAEGFSGEDCSGGESLVPSFLAVVVVSFVAVIFGLFCAEVF